MRLLGKNALGLREVSEPHSRKFCSVGLERGSKVCNVLQSSAGDSES